MNETLEAVALMQAQADRIEAKLDALLSALADEQDDLEDVGHSLDGQRIPGDRDTNNPL